MGVVSPERERTRPRHEPPAGPPPPPPPPRGGSPWTFLTVLLVILTLVGSVMWIRGAFPDFENPFAERTVDRTQPAVLKAIQDVGEYRAATGNFEVIVDLEKDTRLPSELLGERTLFVAVGSVDAGIDLAGVDDDAVDVSDDRTAATITLPRARLYEAELDLGRSYVFERERGLLNRVGSVFSDDEGYEREVYAAAERRLDEAARASDELTGRAEENTRSMLESLVRALGFERVDVRFR
jgi:Protein of unknown function (DUF4230)